MSLKLQAIGPIPEQTVKVAKAAFPNGNTYITMRDELGVFFSAALANLNGNRPKIKIIRK